MMESLSQSRWMDFTEMKLPEVSPLVHCACRDRESPASAWRLVIVLRTAVRSANPCMRIEPVSTSWAMATTRPLSSYFRPSRNFSICSGSAAAAITFPEKPPTREGGAARRAGRVTALGLMRRALCSEADARTRRDARAEA